MEPDINIPSIEIVLTVAFYFQVHTPTSCGSSGPERRPSKADLPQESLSTLCLGRSDGRPYRVRRHVSIQRGHQGWNELGICRSWIKLRSAVYTINIIPAGSDWCLEATPL